MTKLDRIIVMEKTAAPTWLRNTGTLLSKGLLVGAGASAGAGIGSGIADISHGGSRVGAGPRALWEKEYKDYVTANTDPELLAKGNKARQRLGLFGLGSGVLASIPFTRNPLIILGAGLSGRAAGRWIAKTKNPNIDPKMDPHLEALGKFRGMMTDEQAKIWMQAMHAPALGNAPDVRKQLVEEYTKDMSEDPEYQSYLKKKKIGTILGGIAGAGAMATGMIMGKKHPINGDKIRSLIDKGMTRPEATKKVAPTKLQSIIGGDVYWPWLGLGAAGMGVGAVQTLEGGRRGGIKPGYTRRKTLEEMASQGGMNLMSYGGGPS